MIEYINFNSLLRHLDWRTLTLPEKEREREREREEETALRVVLILMEAWFEALR